MKDIMHALKESDLFKDLDTASLKELAELCRIHELKTKEVLFHEGFEGSHFYYLTKGALRLFKTSFEGEETTIKIIHPGEFFAEVVLFGSTTYPVTAIAVADSEVLALHRDSFLHMLESPGGRNGFIASLFRKLRFLSDRIHYLTAHDVEDRFFHFLSDNYGKQNHYTITIPKKDIASAIGTIPETFSRLILRLTKRGIIAWKENSLILKEGFWDESDF